MATAWLRTKICLRPFSHTHSCLFCLPKARWSPMGTKGRWYEDVWPQHHLSGCKTIDIRISGSSPGRVPSMASLEGFMGDSLPFNKQWVMFPVFLLSRLCQRPWNPSAFLPHPGAKCGSALQGWPTWSGSHKLGVDSLEKSDCFQAPRIWGQWVGSVLSFLFLLPLSITPDCASL